MCVKLNKITAKREKIHVKVESFCQIIKAKACLLHGAKPIDAFLPNKIPDITEMQILNVTTTQVVPQFTGRVTQSENQIHELNIIMYNNYF